MQNEILKNIHLEYLNLKKIANENENLFFQKNDEMDAIIGAINSLRPILEKNKLIN